MLDKPDSLIYIRDINQEEHEMIDVATDEMIAKAHEMLNRVSLSGPPTAELVDFIMATLRVSLKATIAEAEDAYRAARFM